MAVQPKKKKSPIKTKITTKKKPTIKKKPTAKKRTVKPRKRKKKNKSNVKRNFFIFFALLLMSSFVAFGFYMGKNSDALSTAIQSGEIEGSYTTKKLLEDLAKMKITKPKEEVKHVEKYKSIPKEKKNIVEKIRVKKVKSQNTQAKITKINKKPVEAPKVVKTSLFTKSKKPRLAIIIDDVSKKSQIHAIKATGLVMTPAIFPPSELSMTSHHLARGMKHAMIHLPMESGNAQFNTQYKTLLTHFSATQIKERVKELRKLFPHVRYVNNHTGSVFTSNTKSMKKLYKVLRDEGFIFIDSRTIGSSKVRQITRSFGDAYVSRDIFIDNVHTVPYIHKQLKKAVQIAKKKGYAVAIGHPHKITMKALKSANNIFKDVELVYIDRIYEEN